MWGVSVNYLLYATDAELIASSKYELQALVTTLKEECENNGLNLNASKTKVLVFRKKLKEMKKGRNARSV